VLGAHRQREESFAPYGGAPAPPLSLPLPPVVLQATWNEDHTHTCTDEDDRVGAQLEVYASGVYTRVPLTELEQVTAEGPTSLRDLLWFPVHLRYRTGVIVAAHLPALAPLSWQHPDPEVRLGRVSVLEEDAQGTHVPFGAKLLSLDERFVPLVDLRNLRIHAAADVVGPNDVEGKDA